MKGEPPMTLQELRMIVGIFAGAVILVTLLGFYFFIRWSQREKRRRGGQIALAQLEDERSQENPS